MSWRLAHAKIWPRVLLAGCSLALSGCYKPKPATKETIKNVEAPVQADEILKNVVSILQNSPSVDAFPLALKQLNEYLARRPDDVAPLPNARREQLAAALGGASLSAIEQKEFGQADAEALKDALFLQSVVRYVVRETDGELDAARRLFEWTVRQIELTPEGWQAEGPPYEVCVRGSGNVNERAWVFLELLRQAGLTGAIVGVPGGTSADAIRPWFCSLIHAGSVYLFDPRYGLPVRSKVDSPASLKELSVDPKMIESFVADPAYPYPLTSKELSRFSLLLLVEPSMVAPRMQFLQERLSGGYRVNLFVDFDRLLETASSAIKPIPENQGVRLWQYPQIVRERYRASRRDLIETINVTWLSNPKSARMLQLRGEFDQAIKEYAEIDMQRIPPSSVYRMLASKAGVPIELRLRMVSQTNQDVLYFGGMCQIDRERSQPQVARDWFQRYLESFGGCTLRADEVLEPARLCTEILAQANGTAPSLGKRMLENSPAARGMIVELSTAFKEFDKLVSAETKDGAPAATVLDQVPALIQAIRAAAAESAALKPNLEPVLAALQSVLTSNDPSQAISMALQVREALLITLTAWLNEQLVRRDLYDPTAFKIDAHPLLQARWTDLSKTSREKWSGAELVEWNRMLIDAAFPACMTAGRPVWIAGVLRETARALLVQQRPAEASELLRKGHPLLLSIQRAELLALAKSIETPKPPIHEKGKP